MSDGKFYDIGWHTEFHTKKKKEKAADCIYLTENRECTNRKCPHYLGKCFIASSCPFREKQTDAKPTSVNRNDNQIKYTYDCSLPLNCLVHHNVFGIGRYVRYEKEQCRIVIEFEKNGKQYKFPYPTAFIEEKFIIAKHLEQIVLSDAKKTKRR